MGEPNFGDPGRGEKCGPFKKKSGVSGFANADGEALGRRAPVCRITLPALADIFNGPMGLAFSDFS